MKMSNWILKRTLCSEAFNQQNVFYIKCVLHIFFIILSVTADQLSKVVLLKVVLCVMDGKC